MIKAIATERVFNSLGHLVAVKYHYEDGKIREVKMDQKRVHAKTKVGRLVGRFLNHT